MGGEAKAWVAKVLQGRAQVIIFVPGIAGSELYDSNNNKVWISQLAVLNPLGWATKLFPFHADNQAFTTLKDLGQQLDARELLHDTGGIPGYDNTVKFFQNKGF